MPVTDKKRGAQPNRVYVKSTIHLKCISCLILLQFNPAHAATANNDTDQNGVKGKLLNLFRSDARHDVDAELSTVQEKSSASANAPTSVITPASSVKAVTEVDSAQSSTVSQMAAQVGGWLPWSKDRSAQINASAVRAASTPPKMKTLVAEQPIKSVKVVAKSNPTERLTPQQRVQQMAKPTISNVIRPADGIVVVPYNSTKKSTWQKLFPKDTANNTAKTTTPASPIQTQTQIQTQSQTKVVKAVQQPLSPENTVVTPSNQNQINQNQSSQNQSNQKVTTPVVTPFAVAVSPTPFRQPLVANEVTANNTSAEAQPSRLSWRERLLSKSKSITGTLKAPQASSDSTAFSQTNEPSSNVLTVQTGDAEQKSYTVATQGSVTPSQTTPPQTVPQAASAQLAPQAASSKTAEKSLWKVLFPSSTVVSTTAATTTAPKATKSTATIASTAQQPISNAAAAQTLSPQATSNNKPMWSGLWTRRRDLTSNANNASTTSTVPLAVVPVAAVPVIAMQPVAAPKQQNLTRGGRKVWQKLFPSASGSSAQVNAAQPVAGQNAFATATSVAPSSVVATTSPNTTATSTVATSAQNTQTLVPSTTRSTSTSTSTSSPDYTVLAPSNSEQSWSLQPKQSFKFPFFAADSSTQDEYQRWMLEPRPSFTTRLREQGSHLGRFLAPQPNDNFRYLDIERLSNFNVERPASDSIAAAPTVSYNNGTNHYTEDAARTTGTVSMNDAVNSSSSSQSTLLLQPRMSISDVVKIAVLRHPQITQSISQLAAQNANIDVAKSQYYPQLSTGIATGDLTSRDRGNQQLTLNLQQALFDFGKIKSNVNTEQAKLQVQQANVLLNIDDIAFKVASAIVNINRYKAVTDIATQQVEGTRRILEIAQLRAQAGISSQADPVQAQTYLESAQSNLIAQQSLLRENQQRLRTLAGIDLSRKDFEIPDDLVQLSDLYKEPEFNKIPSMIVAQSQVAVAQSQRKQSELERYPTLLVRGSLSQSLNGRDLNNQNDSTSSAILLEATSNFYQGGLNASQVKAASFAEQAAKSEVNRVYLDVLENLRTYREQIENKQEQIKVLVDRQQSTTRTKELYQEQYKLGTRTVLDLLNAEQAIHASNTELQNARYDIYTNLLQYIATTGKSRDAYDLNSLTIQGVEIQP